MFPPKDFRPQASTDWNRHEGRESLRGGESVYNVRRLRHHPSIVIWVGNNEDYQVQEQAGLTYNYEDKDPENWLKTDFPARYIYEKLLPEVVQEYSPGTFYHPGSPWGDGKTTSDPTVGDMHQWNGMFIASHFTNH